MHEYVQIDEILWESCSYSTLKWFLLDSFGEMCFFLKRATKRCKKTNKQTNKFWNFLERPLYETWEYSIKLNFIYVVLVPIEKNVYNFWHNTTLKTPQYCYLHPLITDEFCDYCYSLSLMHMTAIERLLITRPHHILTHKKLNKNKLNIENRVCDVYGDGYVRDEHHFHSSAGFFFFFRFVLFLFF